MSARRRSPLDFGAVRADKVVELQERLERLGVREEDLEERYVRAGGRGGQKVNKTSNAVSLRHGPSGVVVKAQRERSRAVNRFLARRMLAECLEALRRRPRHQRDDEEPEA